MRGLVGAVRQVELAVHHPLGAVLKKIVRRDRLAVDGDEPPANHRIPVELFHAAVLQRFLKRVALLGLYVDDKAVRRVRRGGLSPAVDQIGAQQHEQHQRQQAHGQRAGLHDGIDRAGAELARGQHQPARRGRFVDAGAQQLDGGVTGHGKQRHRAQKAAHGNQPQLEIIARRQQQRGKTQHAHTQHRQRRGF